MSIKGPLSRQVGWASSELSHLLSGHRALPGQSVCEILTRDPAKGVGKGWFQAAPVRANIKSCFQKGGNGVMSVYPSLPPPNPAKKYRTTANWSYWERRKAHLHQLKT